MNYISHHEVARQYDPAASPDFLFGAFVSDLARISQTKRFREGLTNTELLAGIDFHYLTNTTFDKLPAISQIGEDMRAAFKEFLPDHTAGQSANAGKDLMFDGIQLSKPHVIEALFNTLDSVLAGEIEFTGIERPQAIIDVATYIRSNGPPRYDNPEVLALVLQRTLSNYRAKLPDESLAGVAKVFETYQSTVFEIGPLAMSQTIENLKNYDLAS